MIRFFRTRQASRRGERLTAVFSRPAAAARRERAVKPVSYVLVSVLFSALLFGIFLVTDHGFLKVRRQRVELARLQGEVSQLAAENDRLDADVKALLSEPKAVERIAREDLGLVKPDDVVLKLPKGWQKSAAAAPSPRPRSSAPR